MVSAADAFNAIRRSPGVIVDLLSNPQAVVLGFVTTFIVEGIGGAFVDLLDQLAAALGPVVSLPLTAGGQIGTAFATVGGTLLGAIETVNTAAVSAAAATGPLAPFVLMAFYVAVVLLLARAFVALSDSIPGLASVQTALGWP